MQTPINILILLSLSCVDRVKLKVVSEFGRLDANGDCVFGEVKQVQTCPPNRCNESPCQVPVVLKKICLKNLSLDEPKLVLNIEALGQSLQTLSQIDMDLTYSEDFISFFTVSIRNLNGYHRKLLQELPFKIPIDRGILESDSNETVRLVIKSQ